MRRVVALVAIVGATLPAAWPGGARADAIKDGDRALRAGRLAEAERFYGQAAVEGEAKGHIGLGRVWLRRGRLEKSLAAFRRASEISPGLAYPYYGQGEVLRRQEKCADAIPLLRQATKLDRKFPEAQLALGRCLVATGQIEEGLQELTKGTRWGKEWAPRFLVARGTAEMMRDSLRAAGIDFTRARELAPRDPEVRRAIGDFYLHRGTWALAIPEYQAALALDSTDVEVRYSLARALFYDQSYQQSLEVYRDLVARAPDFAPGQLGLGELLYLAGTADARRYAEAKPPLEAYTQLEPEDAKGWSLLGRTLYRLGERDAALEALERAEQLGERDREVYATLGRLYADRRMWDQALAAFAQGDPGPDEQLLIGQILEFTGRPEPADSVYLALLARDSTSTRGAVALSRRAMLRFRAREYGAAAALFARTLAIEPRDADALLYRGLSLKELKRDAEALEVLGRAAAADSSRADPYFWMGVIHDSQRRTAEAEQAFRQAIARDSSATLASKAYRQLGFYRLGARDWPEAITLLERAVELDPQDAQAWLWLAQGRQNAGRREPAIEGYRRVLRLDPGNVEARRGLKSLGAAGA